MLVPNITYQKICLDLIVAYDPPLEWLLLKAAIAPDDDTEWADVTEADFVGYVRKDFGGWTPAAENGDGEAETTAPTITWTLAGGAPQDIHAVALANTAGMTPILLAVEVIPDGPVTLSNLGDPFAYTPRMQLREKAA